MRVLLGFFSEIEDSGRDGGGRGGSRGGRGGRGSGLSKASLGLMPAAKLVMIDGRWRKHTQRRAGCWLRANLLVTPTLRVEQTIVHWLDG